tara:strand:+ start:1928 stop:2545 length:618 start_codon:yes stop_codon:yes gene_type:complete
MKKFKKAAMFGLDARIALVIFGALSVISGAALYSAIQEAKSTSYLVEMQEIAKAWEQYYLDTGDILEKNSSDSTSYNYYILRTNGLAVDNSVNGWNGPYTPIPASGVFLENARDEFIYMGILDPSVAWAGSSAWTNGYCTAGSPCSSYIFLSKVGWDTSILNSIDSRVDGGDGAGAGKFRWWTDNHVTLKNRVFLEVAPINNPLG